MARKKVGQEKSWVPGDPANYFTLSADFTLLGSDSSQRCEVYEKSDFLFPSCKVAGMTDDLPSPHRPVRLLPALSPVLFISRWHASSILFSVFLSSFFLISILKASSLLITCPYQFNRLSVIFLEACSSYVFFLIRPCLCVSLRTCNVTSS